MPLDPLDVREDSGIDPEQDLLWQLQSACRRDINRIARIEETEQSLFPDPAQLDQTERRSLVRAIFAYVEGVTFAIKDLAIRKTPSSKPASLEERYLAREIAFELDDKGFIRRTRAKLRFLPNLKFAFHLYSRLREFEFTLNTDCEGWRNITSSIQVRDRLTHPKSAESLSVNDEEIRDALRSFLWFDDQLIALIELHNQKQDQIIAQLKSNSTDAPSCSLNVG
jgi:hypothetical protein